MLSKDQIQHLASLAKLDISEKEKEKFAEQLSSVLIYFKQLDDLDFELNNIEATDHITGLKNISREDEVKEIYSEEEMLAAAPLVEKRQIKVKAVFEDEE